MKLSDLAKQLNLELAGNGDVDIHSVATLEEAQPGQISFLANPKYAEQLKTTQASAVIVAPAVTSERLALLKAKDPYYAFAQVVVLLHGYRRHPHAGIHPGAHIDPTATIGENTTIYPGVFVGPRAKIGRDCILFPNVVIYDDCVLGDRVTVHANTTIGQDGFGYATHQGTHHKIPQIGNVLIEDDVEIGSNCAIERAAMGSTVIGKGSKLCDLIAIGHGAKIGAHALIVAQVGIAGSAVLGHHVTLAGQVGVAGHLKIGDHVMLGAQSGVSGDLPDRFVGMGSPPMPIREARRTMVLYTQLPELAERIKKLEQKQNP